MPPESESPLASLTASKVVVVAGKGGVGKTTVTAAIARAAAMTGQRVLVVELDGKPTLDRLLPSRHDQELTVFHLSAPEALEEYLHDNGFRRIAKRLNRSGVIDLVGTAAPGIDDVVVLGKIKQFERSGEYDLIVVDGPAAGHAVTFLTSASALSDASRGGPVKAQADDVLQLLGDPDRCMTLLVTLAETTPVNETVETAFALEERVGIGLGPVVVNAVDRGVRLPDAVDVDVALAQVDPDVAGVLRSAAAFRRSRRSMEEGALARLSERLPLDQVQVRAIAAAGLDDRHIDHLAADLVGGAAADRGGPVTEPTDSIEPARPTEPTDSTEPVLPTEPAGRGGIADLVSRSDVIVCCGSGGVGKTTTAAVLAMEAARHGRRAVVVTIDPARRLADALGLDDGLSSEPQRVELAERSDPGAPARGELWAMMLDTAATFDGLVRRYADDDEQIDRILSNDFYRNMAGAMSGTQEYMAAETLHALHVDDRFDLVIVDTPPSRNALDFLDAPGVLSRFLDHRVFRLAMLPTRGGLKFVGAAAQPIFRAIGKVIGSDVLTDALAFFQAFAGMETGFRERADDVIALLHADDTAFVVVASPRHDTIEEAVWFAGQLRAQDVIVSAAIVNRMHPDFTATSSFDDLSMASSVADADRAGVVDALLDNLRELDEVRAAEVVALAPLADLVAPAPLTRIPLLGDDVHSIDALDRIAEELFTG